MSDTGVIEVLLICIALNTCNRPSVNDMDKLIEKVEAIELKIGRE